MIEQAPSSKPLSSEEAAFAAELSRSNTFEKSFAKAKEIEAVIQAFDRQHFSEHEINEHNIKLIREELDPEYGYASRQIIVSGEVYRIGFDHQLVRMKSGEATIDDDDDDGPDIPRDAVSREKSQEWQSNALSMGFFAIRRNELVDIQEDPSLLDDNPFNVYLVANTPLERVAYHDLYGEMHVSHRMIIPIDGTVDVQLVEQPDDPGQALLEAYIGQDLLGEVKGAIQSAATLTDALHALGKIDLSPYDHVFNNEKADDAEDVINAFSEFIKDEVRDNLGIDFRMYNLYHFGGVSEVRYYNRQTDEFLHANIDENMIYTGDIHSISIDVDNRRFGLVGIMDMEDGSRRHVQYTMDEKLVVVPLQKIPLPKAE